MIASEDTSVLLSGVRSRAHLVYAAAWLRRQGSRGEPARVGVLPTGTFLGAERVTAQDCRNLLTDAAASVETDVLPSWLQGRSGHRPIVLCVGAPALRLIPEVVRHTRSRPHIVVTDEGLGSYGDTRTRTAAYRRNGAGRVWSIVRSAAVESGRSLLTSELWQTYVPEGNRWRVNEAVADEFRRRRGGTVAPPSRAVLLTQPWPELGVITSKAYLAHVADIAGICEAAGLDFALRLHPADPPERYRGFHVLEHTSPAELDDGVIGSSVLLGASSTALLNIAAFYGTRCVRVRPRELAHLDDKLGATQTSLLDQFLPVPVEPVDLVAALDVSGDQR